LPASQATAARVFIDIRLRLILSLQPEVDIRTIASPRTTRRHLLPLGGVL
jgi:hypothetical protein